MPKPLRFFLPLPLLLVACAAPTQSPSTPTPSAPSTPSVTHSKLMTPSPDATSTPTSGAASSAYFSAEGFGPQRMGSPVVLTDGWAKSKGGTWYALREGTAQASGSTMGAAIACQTAASQPAVYFLLTTDPSVKTETGIGFGSPESAVKALPDIKQETVNVVTAYTQAKGQHRLRFDVQDGKVVLMAAELASAKLTSLYGTEVHCPTP